MVHDTDNRLNDLVDKVLCCNQQELMILMSKVKERISGWDQSTVYLASLDDQILPAESFNGCHSKFGQSGWKPGNSGHSCGSSLDAGCHGGGSKQQLGK